jgi:hypothetical protein
MEGRIIRRGVIARWRRDDACATLPLEDKDKQRDEKASDKSCEGDADG